MLTDLEHPPRCTPKDSTRLINERLPEWIQVHDTVQMLELLAELTPFRQEPRRWRMGLLGRLHILLGTTGGAMLTLRNTNPDTPMKEPSLASIAILCESGMKSDSRVNFLREFNTQPFADPLSLVAFERFADGFGATVTLLQSDLFPDLGSNASLYKQGQGTPAIKDDCLISIRKGSSPGIAHVLLLFKHAEVVGDAACLPGPETSMQGFSNRDRIFIDVLHRGIGCFYNGDLGLNLNRAVGLSPQLQKTLQLLLTGQTERRIAETMSLSVHTVHDYVKELYRHFSVRRRAELVARWTELRAPPLNSES